MRDPARIDKVLAAVREAWMKSPDLRFTQLIMNMVPYTNPCPEVFYTEDETLVQALIRFRDAHR